MQNPLNLYFIYIGYWTLNTVYTRILAECKTQNKKDDIVGLAYTRITIRIKITILILI